MANYIDGFTFPIPRSQLDDYFTMASAVAEIWKEFGAIEYREFLADDLSLEGTRSFAEMTELSDDEVIIFGFVTFESKAIRDDVNKKVANDPRIPELVSATDSGFDPGRMFWGGFKAFI